MDVIIAQCRGHRLHRVVLSIIATRSKSCTLRISFTLLMIMLFSLNSNVNKKKKIAKFSINITGQPKHSSKTPPKFQRTGNRKQYKRRLFLWYYIIWISKGKERKYHFICYCKQFPSICDNLVSHIQTTQHFYIVI